MNRQLSFSLLIFISLICLCISQPGGPGGPPGSPGGSSSSSSSSKPSSSHPAPKPTTGGSSAPSTPPPSTTTNTTTSTTDPQTRATNDASCVSNFLSEIQGFDTAITGLENTLNYSCNRDCPVGYPGAPGRPGTNGTNAPDVSYFVGAQIGANIAPNTGAHLGTRGQWLNAADQSTFNIPKDGVYMVFNQARLHNLQGTGATAVQDMWWKSRVYVTRCSQSRDKTSVVALCFGGLVDPHSALVSPTDVATYVGSKTCTGVFVGEFWTSDRITQQYFITGAGNTPVYAGDQNGFTALWAVYVGAIADSYPCGCNENNMCCWSGCQTCSGGCCLD